MLPHAERLLPDGWQLIQAHRSTMGRTLFVWLAFLLSLLVTLLVTASLLPDRPLLTWALAALITFAYFRALRPLPGSAARLLLCREGIVYSEWPFRALSWQDVRETELIAAGEAGMPHRIRFLLQKHFTLPQDEKVRLALTPAGVPDVVDIIPDTLDISITRLHDVIAELLARHNPGSYPGRRIARGLSATGL
ncbi:MAG: hypothetical protein HKUEN07_04650 [Rhodocyclaceae bacterium]|jgi:hypothetical protein|uniref:Uncharacterized protein n=1 Tax=Candidatus Desulfobacillus denitrificans TaxID=2608985 RepID=A0A809R0V7_9PROT|nr:hypothetical protein [Rhodocyclaceae bacterium]BBO21270.1 hypothetical protein DSYM_19690 [Candidatus Desulfobacillus denitrificans]GIK46463.1 MAG: hypothetical protein BroJett012_23660 [Betaproteobacteria bacterium]GJQ53896.1 MAG: hypothetical protein HKUEN07_04650 [Rhodocyclaceae bacterium]